MLEFIQLDSEISIKLFEGEFGEVQAARTVEDLEHVKLHFRGQAARAVTGHEDVLQRESGRHTQAGRHGLGRQAVDQREREFSFLEILAESLLAGVLMGLVVSVSRARSGSRGGSVPLWRPSSYSRRGSESIGRGVPSDGQDRGP